MSCHANLTPSETICARFSINVGTFDHKSNFALEKPNKTICLVRKNGDDASP